MARAGRAAPPPPKPVIDETLDEDMARARQLYERQNTATSDIAKMVNRSQTTIIEWVGKGAWQRNKTDAIETARAAILVKEEAQKATRIAVIERVNIEMQAKILVEHRSDIKAMREVQQQLWQELRHADNDPDTLGDRVNTFKKLADASKNVILLERQAFGIQGAIEDPTEPATQEGGLTQAESAMTSLLGKFASVLGKAQATPLATEVIDIK